MGLGERYGSSKPAPVAMLIDVPRRRRISWLMLLLALLMLAGLMPAAAAAADAPNSLGLNATYDVSATIRWGAGKLLVTSTATITNDTDEPVSALTFNLVPARIGRLVLRDVRVGEDAASAIVDDENVIVELPVALEPGQQTTVTISYKATFNTRSRNKRWLFAKRKGIITAYRWIPWLSKRYTFATPTFGDPFVTGTTSEVRVTLTSDKPNLKFAISGHPTEGDGVTETFVAHDVRDFNFTASPYYQVTTETYSGVELAYYRISLPLTKMANYAHTAFDQFSARVGAYPYDRLVIAESHSGEGMESPGLVWIPQSATTSAKLRYLVTHEFAHQWFYGVVGSDQAGDPFADEALAEFLTRSVIGHRGSKCVESVLDMRVYDYSRGCYYEVIYVQGDNYLNDYRLRVGDDAFWAGVRLYYERYSFKLGSSYKLLQTLDEAAPEGTGGGHAQRFPSLYPGGP